MAELGAGLTLRASEEQGCGSAAKRQSLSVVNITPTSSWEVHSFHGLCTGAAEGATLQQLGLCMY